MRAEPHDHYSSFYRIYHVHDRAPQPPKSTCVLVQYVWCTSTYRSVLVHMPCFPCPRRASNASHFNHVVLFSSHRRSSCVQHHHQHHRCHRSDSEHRDRDRRRREDRGDPSLRADDNINESAAYLNREAQLRESVSRTVYFAESDVEREKVEAL